MLDCLDEIESDLSRFHRVDDPMQLSSSRYFRLAERLHYYGGATPPPPWMVAAPSAQPVAPGFGGGAVVVDDVASVASMTADSRFPGVEYVGG